MTEMIQSRTDSIGRTNKLDDRRYGNEPQEILDSVQVEAQVRIVVSKEPGRAAKTDDAEVPIILGTTS